MKRRRAILIVPLQVANVLDVGSSDALRREYDVCVDKGTYDAVSLGADAARDRPRYVASAAALLADGGRLVLTSCNWTKDELVGHFAKGKLGRLY